MDIHACPRIPARQRLMSLRLDVSAIAMEDIALQMAWYLRHADESIAARYEKALRASFQRIAAAPSLGRVRRFSHVELAGLRSFVVERPFDRFVFFYRADDSSVIIERVMHGMRDLPRRLLEPPDGGIE